MKDEDCYIVGKIDQQKMKIRINSDVFEITPFLSTELTLHQTMSVFAVSSILKINMESVVKSLSNFKPKEGRLTKRIIKGKEVIFDGDVTHPSRLVQLANNTHGRSVLIVHEFDFGIDPIKPKIKGMIEVLGKFGVVRISKNASIPKALREAMFKKKLQNVSFVEPENIMNSLPSDSIIFYHHGTYFRRNDVNLL